MSDVRYCVPVTLKRTVSVTDLYAALKSILNALLRPMWVDPTTSRVKADVTATQSGTWNVGTVTTLTNLGTANVTGMYIDRTAWGQNIRPRIT